MGSGFMTRGVGYNVAEVAVQAPYALIKGDRLRATLDLSALGVVGAELFIAVGTGGTALTNGVTVNVAKPFVDATFPMYASSLASFQSRLTCGLRAINAAAGYAAGSGVVGAAEPSFAFDGSGGTAFLAGEKLFFWGLTAIPIASGLLAPANGCEILTASKGTTTPLSVVSPCKFAKIDNECFSQADAWGPIWVSGGGPIAITWDYGDDSDGAAVACMCHAKVYTQIQHMVPGMN